MRIHLLFFAQARERVGHARATLELPDDSRVADALAHIERTHPALVELMPHLAVAVNQKLARPGDRLPDEAELALLPPVSGGRGRGPRVEPERAASADSTAGGGPPRTRRVRRKPGG